MNYTRSLLLAAVLSVSTAQASVIFATPASFPGSAVPITFTGLADGTEVNGLTVDGVLFSYSLGNDQIIIDGGPGPTNNIAPPNVVVVGDPTGILTLTLPGPASLFGYGYAVLNTVPVLSATTITLFSGVTNVGSLSYDGVPDPNFAGGFAGIQSTLPFDRVQLTFSAAQPSWAVDNVRFAADVPEPSTILFMLTGGAGILWLRRRALLGGRLQ